MQPQSVTLSCRDADATKLTVTLPAGLTGQAAAIVTNADGKKSAAGSLP